MEENQTNQTEGNADDSVDSPSVGQDRSPDEALRVTPLDLTEADRLSEDQVTLLNELHETLARELTHSLGASLGVSVEVRFGSVEQPQYARFLEDVDETGYLAAIRLEPLGVRAAIHLESDLAFPMIDLLLGGQGKAGSVLREMTEIETQVLATMVGVVVRDLGRTFRTVLDLRVEIETRVKRTEGFQLMQPNERTLSVAFEMKMQEAQGKFRIAFPAVLSNALLEEFARRASYRRPGGPTETSEALRERLLNVHFPVELALANAPIMARNLLGLEVGHVLSLPHAIEEPALLRVGDQNMFRALPVRENNSRSALVRERLMLGDEKDLS